MPKMTQQTADHAAAIHRNYLDRIEAINADPSLSDLGKQVAAARVHVEQKRKMDDLHQRFQGAAEQTVTTKSKSLFGQQRVTGADAISVRDASDRAEQLEDPAAALNLYQRAVNNGDDHLARAIVQKAYDTAHTVFGGGWQTVVEAHAQQTPGFAEQFNEMTAAASNDDDFRNAGHFILFPAGPLNSMQEHRIESLANAEQEASA